MSMLQTVHQRKSFVLTAVLMAVILLLMFFFGLKYYDPPIEYGVAVNFGNSDFGQGPPVEETAPAASESEEVEIEDVEEIEEVSENMAPSEAAEEMVMQDDLSEQTCGRNIS